MPRGRIQPLKAYLGRMRWGWPRRRRGRVLVLISAVISLLFFSLATWYVLGALFAPSAAVRVLYAETSSCSARERRLVAGVMRNRIHNPAFGNEGSLRAVVLQPRAFSCVGTSENWRKTLHPSRMTAYEQKVWADCVACIEAEQMPAVGPSGRRLVYYHDKSIGKPGSWDNSAWRAVREVVTEHFVFYSIVPAERGRR